MPRSKSPRKADSPLQASLRAAAESLTRSERVWIGTHVDPDGDAFGSALGLAHGLRRLGSTVTVACADAAPWEVRFLPGIEAVTNRAPQPGELAVTVDAAEPGRLGVLFDPMSWPDLETIVVDHHTTNPGFGDINVIDPSRSSTAEIVLDLLLLARAPLDPEIATCLLTGLVTDTLGFRTPNTNAQTLESASCLVEMGASLASISERVFQNRPMASLKLTAIALERLHSVGPFALSWLERRDFEATGAGFDAARGIASTIASAAEPLAVALLREDSQGRIDVSLRSKPGVDLVPVAAALGGGGHPQASGAKLPGPIGLAREVVLDALREHIVPVPESADGRDS